MSNQQFTRDGALPEGWIDLSIGEANLIKEALGYVIGFDFLRSFDKSELEYQPAQGNRELVLELENIHSAPCVVTMGAKQAVYCALMTAKERGCTTVGMMDPAWPPLVHAVQQLGMRVVLCQPQNTQVFDCYLLVSPNNPDGRTLETEQLLRVSSDMKELGKFLIHDAVYACKPYTSVVTPLIGDVQIHSVSKRFGLSGLRVGWAVSNDESVIDSMQDHVETITAGVCGTSQASVVKLLRRLKHDRLHDVFIEECCSRMSESRSAATQFNNDILVVDKRQLSKGAFAWCKKGPMYDPTKLMTRVIDGAVYGHPNHVRINLVGNVHDVRELARRTYC